MCFSRKASLGEYRQSRSDWVVSYRAARVSARRGGAPNYRLQGVEWKAVLVVYNERNCIDSLTISARAKLVSKRIIDEIVAE